MIFAGVVSLVFVAFDMSGALEAAVADFKLLPFS